MFGKLSPFASHISLMKFSNLIRSFCTNRASLLSWCFFLFVGSGLATGFVYICDNSRVFAVQSKSYATHERSFPSNELREFLFFFCLITKHTYTVEFFLQKFLYLALPKAFLYYFLRFEEKKRSVEKSNSAIKFCTRTTVLCWRNE